MSDFIGDKKCVTHHHACDCREAQWRELVAIYYLSSCRDYFSEAETQRIRELRAALGLEGER